MTSMQTTYGTEYSFWGNVIYPTNQAAKEARDTQYRLLKSQGKQVKRTLLRNQLRPYVSMGVPDGRSGHVYGILVIR